MTDLICHYNFIYETSKNKKKYSAYKEVVPSSTNNVPYLAKHVKGSGRLDNFYFSVGSSGAKLKRIAYLKECQFINESQE